MSDRENRYAEAIIRAGWLRVGDVQERDIQHALRTGYRGATARAVMAVADEEIAAALREAAAEFASRTQEAAGQVREHWRGQDFVDGQDTAYESAAEWLEARADREARP